MIAASALLPKCEAWAGLASHAPSLSVHESHYGIGLNGDKRESVQSIQIRIASYAEPETQFEVQSFFLRKGKPGELPKIDDTVIFEVVNPHATYHVTAKPIPLPGCAKPSKSTPTNGSKSKQVTTGSSVGDVPREGFVVRILCDGNVINQHSSGHHIQEFAQTHHELLDQAAAKKSARHLESKDILLH